jgi:dihydropteroate synthase
MILLGVSRKGFINTRLAKEAIETAPTPRDESLFTARLDAGTVGACAVASMHGASMLRVHSVEAVRDALAIVDSIKYFDVEK